MWGGIAFGLALGIGVPGALSGKDNQPESLTMSSKWAVDYDADACHLIARFGAGDDAVTARFTRFKPGDQFDFAVFGNRLNATGAIGSGTVDFGLRDRPVTTSVMLGGMGKFPAVFFHSLRLDGAELVRRGDVLPDLSPEREAAVKGVTIAIRGKRAFRLEFGSLGKPMAALRTCLSDLVRSWGFDPEVQARLSRGATPLAAPQTWMTNGDFPAGAAAGGHSGFVQFRLDIEADGKVSGCHVLYRTNPDDFADLTCRILSKRAKLKPALDAQGKPVRSFFTNRVNWEAGL
ncbi:MAG: energy transducer TonB [Sphingomonas sp.]